MVELSVLNWRWAAVAVKQRRGGANARMDMTWVTDRIAVGGGIWVEEQMAEVAQAGVTHVIDMQIEFDDTRTGRTGGSGSAVESGGRRLSAEGAERYSSGA